jgi:hypothetical protein
MKKQDEIKVLIKKGGRLLATTFIGIEYVPDGADILEFCLGCIDDEYLKYDIEII